MKSVVLEPKVWPLAASFRPCEFPRPAGAWVELILTCRALGRCDHFPSLPSCERDPGGRQGRGTLFPISWEQASSTNGAFLWGSRRLSGPWDLVSQLRSDLQPVNSVSRRLAELGCGPLRDTGSALLFGHSWRPVPQLREALPVPPTPRFLACEGDAGPTVGGEVKEEGSVLVRVSGVGSA